MANDNLTETISKNLAHFRKLSGMTQAQLAQKLNYSDKSVSKWERGEGVPDALVLYEIANIFGVTVNDFFDESSVLKKKIKPPLTKGKKILITVLSSVFVWFVMTSVFVMISLILSFNESENKGLWIIFIYAMPIMSIVDLVLCEVWKWRVASGLFVSLLIWGVALSVHLSMSIFLMPLHSFSLVYLIPAVMQILVALWYTMRILKYKK